MVVLDHMKAGGISPGIVVYNVLIASFSWVGVLVGAARAYREKERGLAHANVT